MVGGATNFRGSEGQRCGAQATPLQEVPLDEADTAALDGFKAAFDGAVHAAGPCASSHTAWTLRYRTVFARCSVSLTSWTHRTCSCACM